MKTKEKLKVILYSIWQGILGLISPVCCGVIFMMLTGNGKGYGYDLRADTNFYIALGVFFLILWLIFVSPIFIWAIVKYSKHKIITYLIPCFVFLYMFFSSVLIMGIPNFFSFFNICKNY